tara:strand:- start:2391 stop:3038 length:648 start_codon:yes stop_codon:yes gene_type:complete
MDNVSWLWPGFCAGVAQSIVGHPFDTAKTLIQNHHSLHNITFKQYYRGFIPPLLSSITLNTILFPCYETVNDINNNCYWLSGAISGVVVTPFIYSLENIKIMKQLNLPITYDILYRRHGLGTTFSRESIAFSIYFSTYEYAKSIGIPAFIGGAASGITNWLISYPLDVIKTRQIAKNQGFIKAWKRGNLYKGIGIVLARGMIVNSAVFGVYDYMK